MYRLVSLLSKAVAVIAFSIGISFSGYGDSGVYKGLKLRNIGPGHTSGRISDFAFDTEAPNKFYVAVASGGVWKTENAGTTWKSLFDHQNSYAVGVVEINPANTNEIWVGTGENNNQRSVGYGDGVYKSTDGGKSWRNVGLKQSGHIGQIAFDPRDPEIVYVAALGPLWSDGGERGLYKTSNGGESWEKLLDIDKFTGVNEFIIDPENPDRIIVSTYERYRRTWAVINGGPGSAIYRTEDGGKNWNRLVNGLPSENIDLGRISFGHTSNVPHKIYAHIEGKEGTTGVYLSEDFGETWNKRSSRGTNDSAYYGELTVDPNDSDHLILIDTFAWESRDGGRTWGNMGYRSRHSDDHAVWFDPQNSEHIYIGGDGGIYETWDDGDSWRHINNLPITQFYRVQPDNSLPFYRVCGGTQDNNSLCGPSRTNLIHGVVNSDWEIIVSGDGFEPQIDPENPDIIYAQYQYAGLARYDRKTTERTFITPQPKSGEERFRWNWNSPLLISPHNSKRIYFGAEKIFRSDDRGDNWTEISPDLRRDIDRNELKIGGRVWSVDAVRKNYWTSPYGSAIVIAESSLQKDLLYVGMDDGLIHISANGGGDWQQTQKVSGVPEMTYVSDITLSVHDAQVAYVSFDNHKRGDYKPYIVKTTNGGKSWSSIAGNLPGRGSVHTIAQDHEDPDLLFAGTEFGVFYTQDGGKNWYKFKNLPTVAVRDIEIQRRENDLVIGTFGRGIYILDDYTPLRVKGADLAKTKATFMPVKNAYSFVEGDRWGNWGGEGRGVLGANFYRTENPEFGATFTYYLRDGYQTNRSKRLAIEKDLNKKRADVPQPDWDQLREEDRERDPVIVFTVLDDDGRVVRRISAPSSKGLHQINWDLRTASMRPIEVAASSAPWGNDNASGYLVAPGTYRARMEIWQSGERNILGEQSFVVKSLGISDETAVDEARAQLADFQLKTAELVRGVSGTIRNVAEIRKRIASLEKALFNTSKATNDHHKALQGMSDRLYAIEVKLTGDDTISSRFELTPWSVNERVNSIVFGHWASLSPVTGTHKEAYDIAKSEFDLLRQDFLNLKGELQIFEASVDEIGAPWTPGRLPEMRQ